MHRKLSPPICDFYGHMSRTPQEMPTAYIQNYSLIYIIIITLKVFVLKFKHLFKRIQIM